MKRFAVLLLCLLLCGCKENDSSMDAGLSLRNKLLTSDSCFFEAGITADYGDETYTFAMGCEFDAHGNLSFVVQSPQTITGIVGEISAQGGKIKFDDTALAFPLLADGQLSPVSAPWIFMKTLRSGFITSAGMDNGMTRLIIDETYEEKTLTIHVWLNEDNIPLQGDVYWNGRRILTVEVANFRIV